MQTTATTEQVWLAWADPARICQWFVDEAKGRAQKGETVTWRFADLDTTVSFVVAEAVPERHLLLEANEGDDKRGLTLDIEAVDGKAKLVLEESGHPEGDEHEDRYQATVSGWKMAMAALRIYLERFFGRDKRCRTIIRPTKAEYTKILEYFTNPERVADWIGDMSPISEARPYRLRLESGGELTGRVLAITDREVLLGADQIDGFLELKAFPKGDGRAVGMRFVSWRFSDEQMTDLEGVLLSALTRLTQELD